MTIDEAIETLTDIKDQDPELYRDDEQDAIKLGIEALKSIKEHRAEFGNIPYIGLPGETKD